MTRIVASAVNGAPSADTWSGVWCMRPKTTGSTVTGISMFTVPTMVGVRSRRNRESRAESTIGSNDDAATSAPSSAGPPWDSAAALRPMKAPAGPMASTYPAPIRPARTACSAVHTPLMATALKTAQDRYASLPPAARITIVGIRTMLAPPSITSCRPQPKASAAGGLSSG